MRSVGTFAIIVLLCTSFTGQWAKPLHPSAVARRAGRDKDAQMWLEDANVLTQEIIDDGTANLPKYNDFVMNARLAEAWWKVDQKRGRQFLKQASLIGSERKSDTPIEGFRRLAVAVTVIQIVEGLDHESSEVVLDSMLAEATRLGPQAKNVDELRTRRYFADQVVMATNSHKATTTEQRAKLFRAMIRLGIEDNLVPILIEVCRKNPSLGNQLYSEALDEVASGNASVQLLQALATLPIAESELPISSPLKEKMLKIASEVIERATINGVTEESCKPVMGLAMLVLYFPAESQTKVRGIVEQCKAAYASKADRMRIDKALDQKHDFGSADEVLQLADNETDTARRAGYKEIAAGMLASTDPDRAMSVLDGMTPAEKEKIPWLEATREGIEQGAIVRFYKTQDFGGLQRLIDHSPAPAKTALAIAKITIEKNPSYAASLMPAIVDRLSEGRFNDSDFYIDAVNYVAKTSKPMIPAVFRDAMKGVNAGVEEFIPGQSPDPEGGFKRTSFWWQLEPAKLPSLVDVMDPRSTRLTIDTLKFPMARASMRLWLLNSELRAYETASKAHKSGTAHPPPN